MTEDQMLVEDAMAAAASGSAGHWPTVAGYLHDEVLRLRAQVDLMSRALQATAYIDRDKLMAAASASPSAASKEENP